APNPARAPTVARPQPRPSACHSAIAIAGERRGQRAPASSRAAGTHPTATALSKMTAAGTADQVPSLLPAWSIPDAATSALPPPACDDVIPALQAGHARS